MTNTIKQKGVWDYIADLVQRISRLETGGKPMVEQSDSAKGSFPISANSRNDNIAVTLSWEDSTIEVPPKADPQFTIYVDNDANPNYEWPFGSSLSSGQKKLVFDWFLNRRYMVSNPGSTRVTIIMENQDSSPHTYYFYINWTYLVGSSGSR